MGMPPNCLGSFLYPTHDEALFCLALPPEPEPRPNPGFHKWRAVLVLRAARVLGIRIRKASILRRKTEAAASVKTSRAIDASQNFNGGKAAFLGVNTCINPLFFTLRKLRVETLGNPLRQSH